MKKVISPIAGYWRKSGIGETYVPPGHGVRYVRDNAVSSSERTCKKCGAPVEFRTSGKGRSLPYEVGMAHLGTLHSCATIGRGLSKKRAEGIEDLFDYEKRKQFEYLENNK